MVPANSVLKLEVKNSCGNFVTVTNLGPFSTSVSQDVTVAGLNIYKGKILDCNNAPVNDIIYLSSLHNYAVLMSDDKGEFIFTITACSLQDSMFSLRFGTGYTTIYKFPYTAGITNLGNLSIYCSGDINFMEYNLNYASQNRFVSNTIDFSGVPNYDPDLVYHAGASGNQTVVARKNTSNDYIFVSNNPSVSSYDAAIVHNTTDTLFLKRVNPMPMNTMVFEENSTVNISYGEGSDNSYYRKFNSADTTTYVLSFRYKVQSKI
jgi:hypothetical protein